MSGNLSFLNWLTIVPSLACFDDASLGFLFHSKGGAKKAVLEIQHEDAAGRAPKPTKGSQQIYSHKHPSYRLILYRLTTQTFIRSSQPNV